MFGGIGDLFKGLDLNNLNFPGIAEKVINLVPDGKGKQAMDIGLNVAKTGGTTRDVKKALEDFIPGAKEKLTGSQTPPLLRQIWENIPDDPEAVVTYGKNVIKQLQLLK